jgi:hypothetical protein
MKIILYEESGMARQIETEKAVTRIGSASLCDLVLSSSQVAAIHLQVLYTREMPDRCSLVNLSAEPVALLSDGLSASLPPYETCELFAGDEAHLPGARLRFELPVTTGALAVSTKIGASLHLPEPVLRPNATLLGRIIVKNQGEVNGCQFEVEVGGLPEACFKVDPVPLLYAGAQEEVNIRFFHHKTFPQAGFHTLTISVTAPSSYPGEQTILRQGLYVMPLFEQGLEIGDDMPVAPAVLPVPAVPPAVAAPADSPLPVLPISEPSLPVTAPEPVRMPLPLVETAPLNSPSQPPPPPAPRPKVVRPAAESFWDE